MVPQDVPNTTSDLSHMVCPKCDSHVYKLKRLLWEIFAYILWLGVQSGVFIGDWSMFQNKWQWLLHKKVVNGEQSNFMNPLNCSCHCMIRAITPSYKSYSFDTMTFFMHWIINANLNIARTVDKWCADSDTWQVSNLCGCPIQGLFQAFS
jgi:hypothetical protein